MSATQQMETITSGSKPFTRETDNSTFTRHHFNVYTTTVYLLRPPHSSSSSPSRPWIISRNLMKNNYTFLHPLTSKPHSFNLNGNLDFSHHSRTAIAAFYSFDSPYPVDKLLVLPTLPFNGGKIFACRFTLLALYGGGQIQGCPRLNRLNTTSPWINLSPRGVKFDDIVSFKDKIFVVDRQGITKLINYYKAKNSKINLGKTLISHPLTPGSGRFGWRKRFAVDQGALYLVVRMEEKLFDVFRLKRRGKGFYWDRVDEFKGNKVLFMGRDCCFFRRASRKFPGREYKNCIVFSEAAFPQYGDDCWEFTQRDDRQFSENDIAVFRLYDERFAREGEGENSGFPKIDWSPPDWVVFNVSSLPTGEFKKHLVSESSSQSEREPDDDEGLDSDSGEKNDGEVHSNLNDSQTKDEDEQGEMEFDFDSQDQDLGGVESDSGSQDQGGVEYASVSQDQSGLKCDLDSQEKENDEMHSKEANIEGGTSLPKDPAMPSLSAIEEEVTRTLLRMKSGNDAAAKETSGKNVTQIIPKASTYLTTERDKSDSATAKFERFDIRLDSVSTLEKIWQKHGNIVENCAVRNGEIIARALESLVTIVHMLDDKSPLSLSDSQADYLVSTLSDLRYIHFKVDWLIPFVEKAEKIHKSKASLESLNNLSQLSSKAEERRAILLNELTKLDVEEKKRKEEMGKISKTIPFYGQVKCDKPVGSGLA